MSKPQRAVPVIAREELAGRIWEGSFLAWLAGCFFLLIPTVLMEFDGLRGLSMIPVGFAIIVIPGAIFALPFAGLAYLIFAFLRHREASVPFWLPAAIMAAIVGGRTLPSLAPFVIAPSVGFGLVTGLAFWFGAFGRTARVQLRN